VAYYAIDESGQQSNRIPIAISVGDVPGGNYSLALNGGGPNDTGRVKIPIDFPGYDIAGPAIDVGQDDFTIEFWLSGSKDANQQAHDECLPNAWIYGNIVLDRDRYGQGRAWGLSVLNNKITFGVSDEDGEDFSLCGSTDVLDERWHHIAVTRNYRSGEINIFVDGVQDASARGPRGDISYPDDGMPADYCDGPCFRSDPFLVIGAEKHDAGPKWMGFTGLLDELRISTGIRYGKSFEVPGRPLRTDESTVALLHFDEGSGIAILDDADPDGRRAIGFVSSGGQPAGPTWIEFSATKP
jgi:hypothetical protein